jgi:hypothetical protein
MELPAQQSESGEAEDLLAVTFMGEVFSPYAVR